MKVTFGISAYGQNPAAALFVDGSLVAFAEEERFTRQKGAYMDFPKGAVDYCLKSSDLTLSDVDEIAMGWDYGRYRWQMPAFFAFSGLKYFGTSSGSSGLKTIVDEVVSKQPRNIEAEMLRDLNMIGYLEQLPRVRYFSHHLSHAASTFFASGFDEALVLVIDGSGEEKSTSVYMGQNGQLKLLESVNIPDSLGWYYAAFVDWLGFKPYEQDGYLMGLAPFGKLDMEVYETVCKVLKMTDEAFEVDPKYTMLGKHRVSEYFSDKLVEMFGKPRRKGEEISRYHKNVAFAVQMRLEEVVMSFVQRLTDKYPFENLCLAGGVAQNVKLNGRIRDMGLFKKLYIQPASHDCGVALGAGWLSLSEAERRRIPTMDAAYWGPEYNEKEIKEILDNAGVVYRKLKNPAQFTASALAHGKIVGWFQGRMEAGPRALGNRSILANPCMAEMHDLVNERVKFRDRWRPFCPSVTVEKAGEYFEGIGDEGWFMNCSYQVVREMRDKIPAVVHVDGSARPQVVSKKQNPLYYQVIKEFGQLSGHAVVMNTSLNVKGEPIACTPHDALRCFFSTGMDMLVLGNFVLLKAGFKINTK